MIVKQEIPFQECVLDEKDHISYNPLKWTTSSHNLGR